MSKQMASFYDPAFFNGKKILVTGHTGFKGTWMCRLLLNAGADVAGYAQKAPTEPNIFALSGMEAKMYSVIGDIRDYEKLLSLFDQFKPEIVIHMAAQPLVRESYKNPRDTYEVNVMGTVNVLECIRNSHSVKSFVNVTTDKVYRNREWNWGYRENEELDGYDPYSNSKSCSELVTGSYLRSFFNGALQTAVSTARAGNVIGGGDFASDRVIPDCIRACLNGKTIIVRNPYSTRPYQHVLEPVSAYLMIAQKQYEDVSYAGSYNIGPDETDCLTTGDLVSLFCQKWNQENGTNVVWRNLSDEGPHEANFLKLDCSKMKSVFGWSPCWSVETAIEKVVEWTNIYAAGGNIGRCMDRQIGEFLCKRR